MGVYVYKSIHIDAIKVGHYCKKNAWSRIAHRGFYSCTRPYEIQEKVSVDDFSLICWYPNLTTKDEKKLHKELQDYSLCGEWFRSEAIQKCMSIVKDDNKAHECSKEEALGTRLRL